MQDRRVSLLSETELTSAQLSFQELFALETIPPPQSDLEMWLYTLLPCLDWQYRK